MSSLGYQQLGSVSLTLLATALGCLPAATGEAPSTTTAPGSLSDAQLERALIADAASAERADDTGGAFRVIEVPQLGSLQGLTKSPLGYLATSYRNTGQGKVLGPSESALYRSTNGVRWEALPLGRGQDLELRGVAYGDGTYVVVGHRGGSFNGALVWTSKDGATWTEHTAAVPEPRTWQGVDFAGERFVGFLTYGFAVSADGERWTHAGRDTIQPREVAYGGGRYVAVGTGPVQVSTDGSAWVPHAVDCEAFGDCVIDPDGGRHAPPLGNLLFAEGQFHSQERVSNDGVTWVPAPGRSPVAYGNGRFLELGPDFLRAYTSEGSEQLLRLVRPSSAALQRDTRDRIGLLDRDAPVPDVVEVPFEDGLTCETATCLIIGSRLILVPPETAAPLPDRVPRDAEGRPLLSRDCPVSQQVHCSDYGAREDCQCVPDAPGSPEYCTDVSQFECEGRFEPRGEEWRVEEVSHAGCSCTAIDPNQPPTFGEECSQEQSHCAPPLECLAIPLPTNGGPPDQRVMCSAECSEDSDCPSWEATGFCGGPVRLTCSGGSCAPRTCD